MTTWTHKAKQVETWTSEAPPTLRVFDPAVFDNMPIFDTGLPGGYWPPQAIQAEIWTPV